MCSKQTSGIKICIKLPSLKWIVLRTSVNGVKNVLWCEKFRKIPAYKGHCSLKSDTLPSNWSQVTTILWCTLLPSVNSNVSQLTLISWSDVNTMCKWGLNLTATTAVSAGSSGFSQDRCYSTMRHFIVCFTNMQTHPSSYWRLNDDVHIRGSSWWTQPVEVFLGLSVGLQSGLPNVPYKPPIRKHPVWAILLF